MENKQGKSTHESISVLSKISRWFFSSLKSGVFGRFFTGYEQKNQRFLKSMSKSSSKENRTKRTLARAIERNIFMNTIPRLQRFLLGVAIRDYGIILLTMALFNCGLFLILNYLSLPFSLFKFISAIVIGVVSLPMLFSKKPIALLLFKGAIFKTILFSFLQLHSESYDEACENESHRSASIALLVGLALSAVSYLTGPLWVIAVAGILFLAYQVLLSPESGIIIVLTVLPFISPLALGLIVLYVSLCYIIKCVVGKRVFKFEYIDIWVLLMLLAVALGGFISFDLSSLNNMLLTICLISGFFVISNLICSKEWYTRCIIATCIATTLSSAIAITQYILFKLEIVWDGFFAFSSLHERVSSTFLDPEAFALYLVASLPFLLLFILSGKNAHSIVIGLICSAISIMALVLTYSKIGYIGAITMLVLLLLFFHRNTIYLVLIGIATAVILRYALPQSALDALAQIVALPTNTHAYRLELFDASLKMIIARPFGIGLSDGAFSALASELGISSAFTNCGNLYLQIALESGILGLLLVISGFIAFCRLGFSYASSVASSARRINALAGFCGAIGILISGFCGYVWADKSIIAVFFISLSLTLAYIKIERKSYGRLRMSSVDILRASVDIELDRGEYKEHFSKRKYVRAPKRKIKRNAKKTRDPLDAMKSKEFEPVISDDEI